MISHQEIDRIVNQAKNQRAELIGSGFRSYGLPLALVAAISLVLLQFNTDPRPPKAAEVEIAQVVQQAT
jgi:hypothetical protein